MLLRKDAQAALRSVNLLITKFALATLAALALLIFAPKTIATLWIYDLAILAVFAGFLAFSIVIIGRRYRRLAAAVRAERSGHPQKHSPCQSTAISTTSTPEGLSR
jgi:hypothetical protein